MAMTHVKVAPVILVVSKERDLADIRAHVLRAAGYRVESAMDLNTFATLCAKIPKVDLVIIGYSLPTPEKLRVCETAKRLCSTVPILELYEHGRHELSAGSGVSIHQSHTPEDFVTTVQRILAASAFAPEGDAGPVGEIA
jgi:CheY-like chemotaxis protein